MPKTTPEVNNSGKLLNKFGVNKIEVVLMSQMNEIALSPLIRLSPTFATNTVSTNKRWVIVFQTAIGTVLIKL